jgi:hypothetical protein
LTVRQFKLSNIALVDALIAQKFNPWEGGIDKISSVVEKQGRTRVYNAYCLKIAVFTGLSSIATNSLLTQAGSQA